MASRGNGFLSPLAKEVVDTSGAMNHHPQRFRRQLSNH
jgi:hypothetical protein